MKKRVLLIATVQSHIAQFHKPLMKLLKDNGWEIHVAARNNLNEKNGLELEYPDKVFDIPFQRSPFDKRNISAYRVLKQILQKECYDVIHCNTPVGGLLGRLAGQRYRKTGTMVYYTAHGFHFYKGAPLQNWILYYPIEKMMSHYTDKLITITEEDYQLASTHFKCPVFHIHGVGVNTMKFYPVSLEEQEQSREKLGIKGKVIINVGELLPNKNQKTAIMAMKQVVSVIPAAQLFIAGNGPEKEKLVDLVNKLNLENHITFLGYTTNLQQYLQVCDLEIACSYREGLPLNVLEAMLCGKPVVASRNRGHNELMIVGDTGYLVDPDDVSGFAKAIIYVLRSDKDYTSATCIRAQCYSDYTVQKELKYIYGI